MTSRTSRTSPFFQLPKDKIFGTTATLGFGKRVDLVIELIEGHPEVRETVPTRFIARLKEAKKLSGTRNTVAHSPLMLTVYEHETEGWGHQELLRKATAQAEKLAKQM